MKITIESIILSNLETVWTSWNNPKDIKQWNAASDDWTTTHSTVDLKVGGSFMSRMEARDGSAGFDFRGIYTRVEPHQLLEYAMEDGRMALINFYHTEGTVRVVVSFDPENENPVEMQRQGWQSILDNFKRHVESKESNQTG